MLSDKALDQASDDQLETILAGLSDGLILLTLGGAVRYANAAALDIHGVERLEELGATVEVYKARFELLNAEGRPLPAGRQPLERLLNGESFDSLSARVQPAEAAASMPEVAEAEVSEASGSEVEKEGTWVECRGFQVTGGEPGLAVLVLQDISEQIEAEARFEQTFEANPAPAVITRLSDLRYVKANQGFLKLTGFTKEYLIGRTVYDYDVLAGAQNRDLALKKFEAGQPVPQMESHLETENGTKFVVVAGQPLELSDERCMLFSFIDLDDRKKAEDALRESEERFSRAFRLAPVPTSISSLEDYRVLEVNDAFEGVTGYSQTEAVGRTTASLQMWVDREERGRVEAALGEKRGYRNLEVRFRVKSGEVLDTLASAEVVTLNGVPCILSMFQDITERRRSEADLVASIEAVMKDASWFSRSVVEKLANLKARDQAAGADVEDTAVADLTRRERQVLEYMCGGWKNDAIAEQLGVARNTVRNYIASIYNKLNVHTRADAILWAKARGIVEPEPKP